MACGARHHYLVSPSNDEEEILALRDKSWQHLCDSLKSSDHDLTLCAAAAVVLDFCELMRPPIMPTMNNTATAPRLIKQCGWDGQTPGLGGSCFWLNVSLELLNCLRSNRTLSWNPDTWGVDMSSMREAPLEAVGDEELWIRRMVYICAKICNFRASSPQPVIKKRINYPELTQRCMGWTILHDWCDQWDRAVPRSLLPLSYILCPEGSTFPEIW